MALRMFEVAMSKYNPKCGKTGCEWPEQMIDQFSFVCEIPKAYGACLGVIKYRHEYIVVCCDVVLAYNPINETFRPIAV